MTQLPMKWPPRIAPIPEYPAMSLPPAHPPRGLVAWICITAAVTASICLFALTPGGCKTPPTVGQYLNSGEKTIGESADTSTKAANKIDQNGESMTKAVPPTVQPIIFPYITDDKTQTAAIRAAADASRATTQPVTGVFEQARAADNAKDTEIAQLKSDAQKRADAAIVLEIALSIPIIAGGVFLLIESQAVLGIGAIVVGLVTVTLGTFYLKDHELFVLGGEVLCVCAVVGALWYALNKTGFKLSQLKTGFDAIGTEAENLIDPAWNWLVAELDKIIGKTPATKSTPVVTAAVMAAHAASAVSKSTAAPAAKAVS